MGVTLWKSISFLKSRKKNQQNLKASKRNFKTNFDTIWKNTSKMVLTVAFFVMVTQKV